MVQFCLSGAEDLALFKQVSRSVAAENGMEYGDESARAEADEEALARSVPSMSVAHPTLNTFAERGTAFSFGTANFAEAPYQVVIGFNGSDQVLARQFSDRFVRAIGQRWRVHEVERSDQTGASPLKQCP